MWIFFTMNPFKIKTTFFFCRGEGAEGARVSEFFSTKNPNLKKKKKSPNHLPLQLV